MSISTLTRIDEICSTISETYRGKDKKVILINTSDVLEGKILNFEEVVNKNLRGQFKKTFKKNDILFSEIRPANKRFAFVNIDDTHNFIASTKLMILRPNLKRVLPEFLYYILSSDYLLSEMQHLAETRSGTFPQITFSSELGPFEIELPDINCQRKIVSILKNIDEKIELNNEINDNLLKQAFAIFESKFTDVCNGTHLVSDYILPKRGKGLLSKDAVKGNIPVVAGGLEPSTFHNVANTSAPVLTISASGANAGFIRLWNSPVWSSDSSFIDKNTSEYVYFWYVFLKKRQEEIYGSQTGSAQPHIYPYHIGALPCSELKINDIKSFNDEVTPLFMEIGNNESENLKLANLRDSLLPKLMSGEIDVDSIEL